MFDPENIDFDSMPLAVEPEPINEKPQKNNTEPKERAPSPNPFFQNNWSRNQETTPQKTDYKPSKNVKRRKKEDKTIEIIIGISIMLGAYLSLSSVQKVETIEAGVINVIRSIFTVLLITAGGYFMCYFAWIKLKKKYNFDKLFPFAQNSTEEQVQIINKKQNTKKEFLSPSEKEFKKYLRQNLPENIEIHCKVRLADILKSETKYRRIIMMHVDYVLFNEDMQPILAIELDDKSHETPEAKERDAIKNKPLESGLIRKR
jgi:hypothetical protein